MKRVLLFCAAALLADGPASAAVEGFTFTGTSQVTAQVAQTSSGRLITTTYTSINREMTSAADGKKSSLVGTCVLRSQRGMGGKIVATGECQLNDGIGTFKTVVSCATMNAEATVSQCSGDLLGSSGKYQGRAGTMTWQSTQSADRRSDSASGSGQWN